MNYLEYILSESQRIWNLYHIKQNIEPPVNVCSLDTLTEPGEGTRKASVTANIWNGASLWCRGQGFFSLVGKIEREKMNL